MGRRARTRRRFSDAKMLAEKTPLNGTGHSAPVPLDIHGVGYISVFWPCLSLFQNAGLESKRADMGPDFTW